MTTKAEQKYLGAVKELGCIACLLQETPGTPPEIHHLREGQGASQRASNFESIGLCPPHHRGTMHPKVPSIHRDRLRFIEEFGTERELLARTYRELGIEDGAYDEK